MSTNIIPSSARHHARQKLEDLVRQGMKNTSSVVAKIMNEVPTDAVVRGDAIDFTVDATGVEMIASDCRWRLHDNALAQLAGRIGIPGAYVRSLSGAPKQLWRHDLLRHNLRELAQNAGQRYLVRAVRGEARAVLSDRFRRLDSRPLLDAFIGAVNDVGGAPYEGLASDLSASVRVIIPRVHEPVPGEYMVFGLSWANSDYGTRAYNISAFALRLLCLNGMVGADHLKQVHLGGRLPDRIEFSAQTYEYDRKTMVEATRDIVRGALGPAAIEEQLDVVRRAHEAEADWSAAWRRVSRDLSKAEQQSVKEAFEGPDVVNLPAGKTTWRLSNAISWLAHSVPDAERRQDLQRLAGAVVEAA